MEYQKTQQFSIFSDRAYCSKFITQLLKASYKELIEVGTTLIHELKPMKEYIYKIALTEFSDENLPEDSIIINRSNQGIEEGFDILEKLFADIQSVEIIENYLEVESLRRNLFISSCRVIVGLQGAMDILEKIASRKKTSISPLPELESSITNVNKLYFLSAALPDKFDILTNKSFLYLKQGLFSFPSHDSTIAIPIDEDDSLTIIAYALSSDDYLKEIEDYQDEEADVFEKIESELLSAKDDHFTFNQSNFDEDELRDEANRASFNKLYGDCISIKVVSYFYKQFHGLRQFCVGSHLDYILSISKSQNEPLHLGKSKAFFKYSLDERFMIKIVGERQFRMFMDFAPNYFRHNCKNKFHQMPSCLVRILGAYYVHVRNHTTGKLRQE